MKKRDLSGSATRAKLAPAERDEAYAFGKKRRKQVEREKICRWKPSMRTAELVELVRVGIEGRLPELIPIKLERMSESAFGFFRGTAPLMAADMGAMASSGIRAQICGDAHVRNLGAYAAPDGRVIFDINDFDETIGAPWEWDVKRLAASLVLAGREAQDDDKTCRNAVLRFASSYREYAHYCCELTVLETARLQVHRHRDMLPVASALHKAARATAQENLAKLARKRGKGKWEFKEEKPLLWRVSREERGIVLESLSAYRATLARERQHVLDAYRPVDVAFKVVGTGSVGLRDYVILCFGRDGNDPLFLQVKEEPASCFCPHLPTAASVCDNQGKRVVEGQRLMQAQSDILLGWTSIEGRDYLVRQLSDHKASIEIDDLKGEGLLDYAQMCGEVLAKGHGRSGNPCAIAGYLGNSDAFDKALAEFAFAYAEQVGEDYKRFLSEMKKGAFRDREKRREQR
jgi:uncharacterized protein (DUF2252 family)